MVAFCHTHSVEVRAVRFFFDGNSLCCDATPNSLGMEDGDEIDVMLTQIGGK
jgi:hypothetical protein